MRQMRGHFITIEGGEGSGKTTLAAQLAHVLTLAGIEAVCLREPGGTEQGELIRQLLVKGDASRWDPLSEALLLLASRHHLIINVIKPALKKGQWVICDRFIDSTLVYQGYAGGVSMALIKQIYEAIAEGIVPDRTFLLDVSAELGLKRASLRLTEQQNDECRFEEMPLHFHQKIREGFLRIAQEDPVRYRIISGDKPQDVILGQVLEDIQPWIREDE